MLDSDQENVFSTKNWNAEDFSRIYVRYKPHLESQVWKLLGNRSQTEDVVQDAFLYLLTTLPNLDSEIGVLRYLKWKSRMLALDLIKSRPGDYLPLEHLDYVNSGDSSSLPEFSLELAEDAAIVQLALSKIHPRQREVLIASVFEERPSNEVASRMGISDNALRQLTHRARQAFKRSLTSEVEARGMSISQFLSGSLRKALDVGNSSTIRGGAAALLVVMSVFGGIQSVQDNNLVSQGSSDITTQSQGRDGPAVVPKESFDARVEDGASGLEFNSKASEIVIAEKNASDVEPVNLPHRDSIGEPDPYLPELAGQLSEGSDDIGVRQSPIPNVSFEKFTSVFSQDLASKLGESPVSIWSTKDEAGSLLLQNSSGLRVELIYDLEAENPVRFAWISFSVDGVPFIAVPNVSFSKREVFPDGKSSVHFVATDLVIGDVSGELGYLASNESEFSKAAVLAQVYFDLDQQVYLTDLKLEART